jgi:hypothetical protein
MTKFKITPILLAAIAGLCVTIPRAIIYLFIDNNGGLAMVGLLSAFYAIAIGIALLIERVIVYRFKIHLVKLFSIECIVLVLVLVVFQLDYSTYYFKVTDNVKWFVIRFNDNRTDKLSTYSFPNNRVLTVDSNEVIFIDRHDLEHKTTSIKTHGQNWKVHSELPTDFEIDGKIIQCIVYLPSNQRLTDTIRQQIISSLKQRLEQQRPTFGLLPGWLDVVAMSSSYQSAAVMGRPFLNLDLL